MIPPFYLTRSESWIGGSLEPISQDEWWNLASRDPDLICETKNVVSADKAGRESTMVERQPVYLSGTSPDDLASRFYWEHGNISILAPSARALQKLLDLSKRLNAHVQDSTFQEVHSISGFFDCTQSMKES